MSIIQDALRRREREEADRPAVQVQEPPPPPPSRGATPPPAPRPDVRAAPGPAPGPYYAYAAPPRRRRSGRWILRLSLVLVLAGAVATAAWYFFDLRGGTLSWTTGGPTTGMPLAQGPAAEPPPAVSDWPAIKLGSLARAGGGKSSAILNGKLVLVGDEIEGVTLVEVAANGVTLDLKGQRLFLKIGDETP